MSIRLDPRRLNALKHLAGEAGVRPGDLVRQWVEERIDASRTGVGGQSLAESVELLAGRVAALEAAAGISPAETAAPPVVEPEERPEAAEAEAPDVAEEMAEPPAAEAEPAEPAPESASTEAETKTEPPTRRTRRNAVAATPAKQTALHDEIIAIIRERGASTAAELATAITERGRYAPPRSGKAIDAAMVSQRVSNPNYRSRFVRREGRIGLSEEAG